jgi:hypothetical protein
MKNIFCSFWSARVVCPLFLMAMAFVAEAQFTIATNKGSIEITGPSVTYLSGIALVIPSVTNGLPVTSIGPGAFEYYNPTSLVIPDTVTNIGNLAFYHCSSLMNVSFGNGVQTIGSSAFENCSLLKSIVVPNSVTTLGSGAFAGCTALTNIVLGSGMATIAQQTFQGCTGLRNVTIPQGVSFIDQEAFEDTGLTWVNIPDSVTNIASWAFDNCANLTNVVLGREVGTIGVSAFDNYQGIKVNFYFYGSPPQLVGGKPASSAQIYYLPGATGWGTYFDGFSTALWNPQAQTADGQFGVRSNHFGFNITGTTNIPVTVEICTNLSGGIWTAAQSVRLTNGSYYFSDPSTETNVPGGSFYRIRSP